jgi:CDP-diglyceride synthetase
VKLNPGLLQRGEYVALLGGLLLAVSVFVKAYEARPENPNANIDGMRGTVSIWDAHPIMRILLLLAALAPFILAWIVMRQHELSWSRGELTAVVGIAAVGLIFYTGVIDRPGEPPSEIELEIGWYGLMLGAILMIVGATMRSSESERSRKPPGVL